MPATTTDAPAMNGQVDVGTWGIPGGRRKRNGPIGRQARELNATAAGQHEHPGEFRVLQRCSSSRVASARASTLRKKLREGTINGLEYPGDRFDVKMEGELVWARYNPYGTVDGHPIRRRTT